MKFIYSVVLVLMLTITAKAANGVVDFGYIASESKAQKSATKQLKDYESALKSGFEKEVEQIKKLEVDLTSARDKFTPKQLKDKETEYNTKVADFQKRAQEKQQSLQQSATEASMVIEKAIKQAVEKIAKEKSLDIVYSADALAYFVQSNNISKEVLVELDKILPKITVRKP